MITGITFLYIKDEGGTEIGLNWTILQIDKMRWYRSHLIFFVKINVDEIDWLACDIFDPSALVYRR